MRSQSIQKQLRSPLFVSWSEQYALLTIEGLPIGSPSRLHVDSNPTPFQYTGVETDRGAQIIVKVGLAANQDRRLEFVPAERCSTDLARVEISSPDIGPFVVARSGALFDRFAAFPLQSGIRCDVPLQRRHILRTNAGPLFTD